MIQASEAIERRGVGYPGRWAGGLAAVCGPLLILTGVLLRIRYNFFYPDQLAAYDRQPGLLTAAYACFAAGTVLLWPAVLVLAHRIGATHPGWALWGGCLVMFGLFTRTFHFGTDHLAFHLVDSHGLQGAITAIDHYYVAWRDVGWHPFRMLSGAIVTGWVVLAIGAYRSGVLGLGRALAPGGGVDPGPGHAEGHPDPAVADRGGRVVRRFRAARGGCAARRAAAQPARPDLGRGGGRAVRPRPVLRPARLTASAPRRHGIQKSTRGHFPGGKWPLLCRGGRI